jgi:hypothetical protein
MLWLEIGKTHRPCAMCTDPARLDIFGGFQRNNRGRDPQYKRGICDPRRTFRCLFIDPPKSGRIRILDSTVLNLIGGPVDLSFERLTSG